VSAASARSGVIQRTRRPGSVSRFPIPPAQRAPARFPPAIHSISGPSHAASVFPVPVAA
jgi:hypothetical protein